MRSCNWYTVDATTCTGYTQTLIINMPLFSWSLTLGFFWSVIINLLTNLNHFFHVAIWHGLRRLVLRCLTIRCSFIVRIIYEDLPFHSTFGTIPRCSSCRCWLNHSFINLRFWNLCRSSCISSELLLSRVISSWILLHPATCLWFLVHFQLLDIWVIVCWMNDSWILSHEPSTVIQVFESVY